jgi:hypothetical protein
MVPWQKRAALDALRQRLRGMRTTLDEALDRALLLGDAALVASLRMLRDRTLPQLDETEAALDARVGAPEPPQYTKPPSPIP